MSEVPHAADCERFTYHEPVEQAIRQGEVGFRYVCTACEFRSQIATTRLGARVAFRMRHGPVQTHCQGECRHETKERDEAAGG